MIVAFSVLVLCLVGSINGQTSNGASNLVRGHLDLTVHGSRLKDILKEGLTTKDVVTVHYAIVGLNYLQEPIDNKQAICQSLKELTKEQLNLEKTFCAVSIQQALKCSPDLAPDAAKLALKTLDTTDAPLADVSNAVNILKALGKKDYEKSAAIKNLPNTVKNNETPLNLGHLFDTCSTVNCNSWVGKHVTSALSQMDEIDGTMLQWEGGLPATAIILSGILGLPSRIQITEELSAKLANYLLSRVSVQTVKGVALLLQSANLLAKYPETSPVCLSIPSFGYVASSTESFPVIVSDLVGKPHPKISAESVVAQSAIRLQDDVVVLSKQKFTRHPTIATKYNLEFMKIKPEKGVYKITLSIGDSTVTISVRVLSEVFLDNVEFGVGDVDGVAAPKMNAIAYPKKSSQVLEADSLQKIIVKFSVKEKGQTKQSKVHQPFVRFYSAASDTEVIFVAESDSSKIYRMDLDVGAMGENFKYQTGSYIVELIVGDYTVSNPIQWLLGEINLKFTQQPSVDNAEILNRTMKKEIIHMFREPDARPPRIVSDVFTGLCIAPLLLLLILWAKVGVNVKNFSFSLSAIGFHLGFGAILGLFFVFWLQLNMFETIRYLAAVGFATFICGHNLLVDVAKKRKKDTK